MEKQMSIAVTPRVAKGAVLGLVCVIIAGVALAGQLNPPAGPVAPTPGPEPRTAVNAVNTPGDADSVFRITQPGSYYLERNVAGQAGKHGVEIAANGVTLDLNGFDLVGVAGSLDGVSVTLVNAFGISVRNGTVRSWGGSGINLLDFGAAGNVSDIVAIANTGAGIRMAFGGTVTRCTTYSNLGVGIAGASGTVITECAAYLNLSHGIATASGCVISRCSARSNGGDGISVFNECVVINNDCNRNGTGAGTGAGIRVTGSDNLIEGNNCVAAEVGIDVDVAGNIIRRNTCSGNTTRNWEIAANNVCLVVVAVNAGAIMGDFGGAAPGSTDPSANFTY